MKSWYLIQSQAIEFSLNLRVSTSKKHGICMIKALELKFIRYIEGVVSFLKSYRNFIPRFSVIVTFNWVNSSWVAFKFGSTNLKKTSRLHD